MLPFVLAAAIALVAFVVRGFSGFGSALIMTPLLALVFDTRLAVATTALLGAVIGIGIAVQAREAIDRPLLLRLMVVALPCIVIGSIVLARADDHALRVGMGIVVIIFGLRILLSLRAGYRRPRRWPARSAYAVGGVSGMLGGALGTSGPPLVVFLENQLDSRVVLRATLLAAIVLLDSVRLATYAVAGVYTQKMLVTALIMLPAALLGATLGARMHIHVGERVFRGSLVGFLLLSGTLLIVG